MYINFMYINFFNPTASTSNVTLRNYFDVDAVGLKKFHFNDNHFNCIIRYPQLTILIIDGL